MNVLHIQMRSTLMHVILIALSIINLNALNVRKIISYLLMKINKQFVLMGKVVVLRQAEFLMNIQNVC